MISFYAAPVTGLVGLVAYVLATPAHSKSMRIGEIMFFTGLLVTLLHDVGSR
jgi:hypothetical protein